MSSSSSPTPEDNKDKDLVNKLQTTDFTFSNNDTSSLDTNDSEMTANLDELDQSLAEGDEYYLNPLVNTNLSTKLDPDTTLDKMMENLENDTSTLTDLDDNNNSKESPITSKEILNALGLGNGSGTGISNYVGDPYVDPQGRIVKTATFQGSLIEIPQNMGMNGYQDYYEEGRLVSFSIACNDPDMIPIVFIENSVGSRDKINELSYREAVTLGRGMTLGEATSTIVVKDIGKTSRDISGQRHKIFPYVSRYKGTFTGTETDYSKIKGTVDDKYFVMNYEPNEYIPYKRLYIDVYNGSTDGNRMVHRIEVKRLIYEDPSQYKADVGETELTDMNRELNVLKSRFDEKESHTLEDLTPVDIDKDLIASPPSPPSSQPVSQQSSNLAFNRRSKSKEKPKDMIKEFVSFLYHKMNGGDNEPKQKQEETVLNLNTKPNNNDNVSYMTVKDSRNYRRRKRGGNGGNNDMEVKMF